jgi:hypothetical protein
MTGLQLKAALFFALVCYVERIHEGEVFERYWAKNSPQLAMYIAPCKLRVKKQESSFSISG